MVCVTVCQPLTATEMSGFLVTPEGVLCKPRLFPGTLAAAEPATAGLHIVVIDGEDGVNIVKKKTAVRAVVEVRDRNNLPVAGAAVTFSSPSTGASMTFSNGSRSVTAITQANGRAIAQGLKPLNVGHFQIGVSATVQSQVVTATISVTNVVTAAAAVAGGTAAGVGAASGAGAAAGISATTIGIIAGVAAAAVVGVAVGVTHAGAGATKSATITAGGGGVTAGAP